MSSTITTESAWHAVGCSNDFPDGDIWPVVADGLPILVYREGDTFYALHDQCSHGPARLSEGFVVDGCVECPLHQGLVDLKTGQPRSEPITESVRAFPIRVVAGEVSIAVPTVKDHTAATTTACAGGCA